MMSFDPVGLTLKFICGCRGKTICLKALIFFVFSAAVPVHPAFAITAGTVYEYCKPYANRGFQVAEDEDVYCVLAVNSVVEAAQQTCGWLEYGKKNGSAMPSSNIVAMIAASENIEINAAIQSFLNWAEKNPDFWDNTFAASHGPWLGRVWRCVP